MHFRPCGIYEKDGNTSYLEKMVKDCKSKQNSIGGSICCSS